jgi:hypothetical protein
VYVTRASRSCASRKPVMRSIAARSCFR